tara:strand:+ start:926 stop:1822 length:897 start_codon:yes stop_codon:yes gene_type:complete
MKNIRPETYGIPDLTSNVAITETEWTAGTYTTGTLRYVGINLYEVVADPSTADEPTVGAAKAVPTWILVGQINRWRMFNGALHQPTQQAGGPLSVTLQTKGVVNSVVALKCKALEAVVTVTDALEGEVYSNTVPLVDNDVVLDIYDYFFEPIALKSEFVLIDLPSYPNAEVAVSFDSGTDDTECGALVLGQQTTYGSTYLNFSLRDRFFSLRERNEFGAFLDTTTRPVAREATFDVFLSSQSVSRILSLVTDVRDIPTVFIGGEDENHSIVFGFPSEPEVDQLTKEHAKLTLTVLGQT